MTAYRTTLAALGCLMLAGTALGQSQSSQLNDTLPTTPPNHTGAANTNNPTATSETKPGSGLVEGLKPSPNGSSDVSALDHAFAEQAARYAKAQVAAGRMALKESKNPKVTEYAHRAVDNGESQISQLDRLNQSLKIKVSDADSKASDETQRMKAAKGSVFDGLYGQLQYTDQKEALALYEKEGRTGENQQLKSYAATMKQNVNAMLRHAEAVANGTIDRTNPDCPEKGPARAGCP
jgi:putative membrane protein